jgi:hypothetical protein
MAIQKIRLPTTHVEMQPAFDASGKYVGMQPVDVPDEVVIDEWNHWPMYSTCEIGLTAAGVADSLASGLQLFTYVPGQRVPATQSVTSRQSNDNDTNRMARKKMNYDESFIFYSQTYEVFALTDLGFASSGAAVGPLKSPAPIVNPLNLRRLDRDMISELFVGAGMTKPQARSPWSYVRQSVGSPAWTSGDQIQAFTSFSYGTGGDIKPQNQRKLELPIYIEPQQVFYLKLSAPIGAILGLTQFLRIRVWFDGMKRRAI